MRFSVELYLSMRFHGIVMDDCLHSCYLCTILTTFISSRLCFIHNALDSYCLDVLSLKYVLEYFLSQLFVIMKPGMQYLSSMTFETRSR